MSRAKLGTQLLDAINGESHKDKALKEILLDLDGRLGKLERMQLVITILLGLVVVGGKDMVLELFKRLAG